MSDWITDRLPTALDGTYIDGYDSAVWRFDRGMVEVVHSSDVKLGQPWQHIPKPAPYVKLKRWTVECNFVALWSLRLNGEHYGYLPYSGLSNDAAQRICDIYNEVIP